MYDHEKRETSSGPLNTTWPLFSNLGSDHDEMKRYLTARNLSSYLAEQNGWYPSREANDTALRIVIPAMTKISGHVYWQARAVSPVVRIRYQSPTGPRQDAIILVKPDEEDEPMPCSLLVEGPMDALAGAMAGYPSVALMGMTPSRSTIDFLVQRLGRRPMLICLDAELEAKGNSIRLQLDLASRGIRTACVVLPKKDLAACSLEERAQSLTQAEKELRLNEKQKQKGRQQQIRGHRGKA